MFTARNILLMLFCIALLSCSSEAPPVAEEPVVNIYSHRHYAADKLLFEKFEKETGIKVNLTTGKLDELIKRLEIEGELTEADILLSVDVGRLHRATEKGLLQPLVSADLAAAVPADLRDPDGHWYALTKRARIIAYAKERVNPAELSTYAALADKKWKGKILVRAASSIYNQSLLASIIANEGPEAAEKWASGIVNNMARSPKGNDRDQMKAVAAGIGDLAIVNSYYVGIMINSDDDEQTSAVSKVGVFFPDQDKNGTHVNISGAGITKHAKHPKNAKKLIEFLLSEASQTTFATTNHEFAVNSNTAPPELHKSWGEFKSDHQALGKLGALNEEAVKLFDKVGWQ